MWYDFRMLVTEPEMRAVSKTSGQSCPLKCEGLDRESGALQRDKWDKRDKWDLCDKDVSPGDPTNSDRCAIAPEVRQVAGASVSAYAETEDASVPASRCLKNNQNRAPFCSFHAFHVPQRTVTV